MTQHNDIELKGMMASRFISMALAEGSNDLLLLLIDRLIVKNHKRAYGRSDAHGRFPISGLRAWNRYQTVQSSANMLSFPLLIAYNRPRSPNSYDSPIHGAVPEVFGAKFTGASVLPLVRTAHQYAFPDAYGGRHSGGTYQSAR